MKYIELYPINNTKTTTLSYISIAGPRVTEVATYYGESVFIIDLY